MLHVKGWGWLEAADGKNLSQTRPAKSESEAYCKMCPSEVLCTLLVPQEKGQGDVEEQVLAPGVLQG